jgi:hypothetical protein
VPSSPAQALAAVQAGLGYLAAADVADWPADTLAGWLRALGRVEAGQLAAVSRVLAAFNAQGGFEADGQASAKAWLRWQARVTGAGSAATVKWMRRLALHPRVLAALGAGQVTSSFARLICDGSDLLVPELRDEADEILLAAAAGGATEADLVMLVQQVRERSAPPDTDGPDGADGDEDGFKDRRVWLDTHYRGAGKLNGDLTPECAAALTAMLDALGKKAGPEDARTESQRHHDALEEACRRLISSGLPDTAGQPTQVQLHVTLDQLRDLPGAADAERAWAAARAAADGTPGWVYSRAAAEAYACDAQLIPVVTGHLDAAALENDFPATASLPLDTGTPTATVPPHLRRLVILRDRHCAFPGCQQKPASCQVHHLIPRSEGGVTALHNLTLLCAFHHLIAVHRWGWTLALNADGTTTATSPDRRRTLHSHGPPQANAA